MSVHRDPSHSHNTPSCGCTVVYSTTLQCMGIWLVLRYFINKQCVPNNNLVCMYVHIIRELTSEYIPRSDIAELKCKHTCSFVR